MMPKYCSESWYEKIEEMCDYESSFTLTDTTSNVSGLALTMESPFLFDDCTNMNKAKVKKDDPCDIPFKSVTPVRILHNDPATIVFWDDGTKTIVKRAEGQEHNPYFAFCSALAKKIFGNNSSVNKLVSFTEEAVKKNG